MALLWLCSSRLKWNVITHTQVFIFPFQITENKQLKILSQGAKLNTTAFQRIPKQIAAQTLSTRAGEFNFQWLFFVLPIPLNYNPFFIVARRRLTLPHSVNIGSNQRCTLLSVARSISSFADIKGALEKRRRQITESVVELEDIARNLTVNVRGWREDIEGVSKEMVEYDFWRWLLTISEWNLLKK